MLVSKGKTGILKGVDFSGIGGDTFDFGGQSLMGPPKKKKKKEPPKTKKTKSTEPTSWAYKDALQGQRKRRPPTPNPHTR